MPVLNCYPTEGEHVLVLLSARENKYYVGKIIKDVDESGDLEISYLRLSRKAKDRFAMPPKPDLCVVHRSDIKAILPIPVCHFGLTKRHQTLLSFDFDFSNFKLG